MLGLIMVLVVIGAGINTHASGNEVFEPQLAAGQVQEHGGQRCSLHKERRDQIPQLNCFYRTAGDASLKL